jgi:hypothetical protein
MTDIQLKDIQDDQGFIYLRSKLQENSKYIPILTKAFYFNTNGDYLASIIYGTLSLWMYQIEFNGRGNSDIISRLTDLIEKSKRSYKLRKIESFVSCFSIRINKDW